MLRAMSPGVYIAIGIILGAGLSILIGNGFIGIGLGLLAGIGLYFGTRALAARRRL
jgi:hypothetical protein